MDRFADTVGLCAVAGHRDALALVSSGLDALRHRGVSRAVAAADGQTVALTTGEGSHHASFAVGQAHAIGADPDVVRMAWGRVRAGGLAVAFTGRLLNGTRLRRDLLDGGAVFSGPSDAELVLHLIAASHQRTLVSQVVEALWRVDGAYALIVLAADRVIAVRDRAGFRPLVLGRIGDAAVIASEDGAIWALGGEVRRPVRAGELVVLDGRGASSVSPFPPRCPSACAHEYVSLARDDAAPFGVAVQPVRRALGERLGRDHPCPGAEVVCGLPGLSESAALGYAHATGLPYAPLLIDAGPVDEPAPDSPPRWRAVRAAVAGRVVVVVSPSVSTGRTLLEVARELASAGAAAVHLRVASPSLVAACPYGVASPTAEELWVHRPQADAAGELGADSMEALSVAALRSVAGLDARPDADPDPAEPAGVDPVDGLCDACFSGRRPLEPDKEADQLPLF